MANLFVGTSGFNYKHWSGGVFYPEDIKQKDWLRYYCSIFKSVELNVTFYRLPNAETFAKWGRETPKDFIFSIKGSRYITHRRRLINPKASIGLFFRNASGLGKKLSVVLWQFGVNFMVNEERLENFCREIVRNELARKARHAFEFRSETWFDKKVYKILRNHNFGLCIADSPGWPAVEEITADFVYIRFHGGKVLFTSNYSKKELSVWSQKVKGWMKQGKDVYAYFNNDAAGYAPKNALTFLRLCK